MTSHRYAMGIVAFAGLPFACSAVPQLEFTDAAADASVDSSDSGLPRLDAATDAATDAANVPSCPGNPGANAICCGSKLCLHCVPSDCTMCDALTTCPGTSAAACCNEKGGPKVLSCMAAAGCK